MTSLNFSHLRKTFILVVALSLCLGSGAYASDYYVRAVNVVSGAGPGGFWENIPAQAVTLRGALGVATDATGNVYFGAANAILKIDARMRTISTVAGPAGQSGSWGYIDGPASSAMFLDIMSLATDANGNVYIAEGLNNAIRMFNVATNTVCTIAANPPPGAGPSVLCRRPDYLADF